MRIHKEGHKIIPIAAMILAGLCWLLVWLIPIDFVDYILLGGASIVFILVVRFFRNPEVECPQKENVIYAPADGKVVVIEKTSESEFLQDERIQISIFMSPLNVHVNRSPIKGAIEYFKYHKGKFLVAWHPKSSTDNERTTMSLKLENGTSVVVRQIAGAVARRIAFYPKVGDQIESGNDFGFIRFGSRVDVFLPKDAQINTKIGDRTKGGLTELAYLS